MKKVIVVLLVLILLAGCGLGGYAWYRSTHVFIEESVYDKDAAELDLRGAGISLDHYHQLRMQLPDCQVLWDVPFQGKAVPSNSTTLTITGITEDDMPMLLYFPELTTIDATGCQDYPMLEYLQYSYPALEVKYQVDLGNAGYAPDTTELVLEEGDYDYARLMENLIYLPQVSSIRLPNTSLTRAQLEEIQLLFPAIALDYSITFRGQEMDPGVTELDLSDLTSDQVPEVVEQLGLFHNLQSIQLMNDQGESALTLTDVQALQEAVPGATVHYSFTFYKQTLSTTDTYVEYKYLYMKDSDEETIRQILDIMDSCEKFVFNGCWISDEVMAGIREDYRDRTKIVWRVYFGNGCSCLTDREVIKAVYGLTDSNSKSLRYCEDARFIDFGHNETLTDISFVQYMPKLEAIILSGSLINDLSPFAGNTSLYFLEVSNCSRITDLTPLADCTNLGMLNISYTGVESLDPIMHLGMDRLKYVRCPLTDETVAEYTGLHPDSWVSNTGHEYGAGWREEEDGTRSEYYKMLASPEVFNYGGNTTDTLW